MIRTAQTAARLTLVLLSLLFRPGATAGAGEPADPAAALPTIRQRIGDLERDLAAHNVELEAARSTLAALAAEIKTVQRAQQRYQQDIAARRAEVARLEAEAGRLREELGGSTGVVAGALRARFALDREPRLKYILSPERMNAAQRQLRYLDYVLAAADAQIAGAERKLADYAAIAQAEKLERDRLELMQAEQAQRLAALNDTLAARKAAAGALESATRAEARRLDGLKRGLRRLEKLLARLHAAPPAERDAGPGTAPAGAGFLAAKGRLPWPAPGRVTKIERASGEPGGANWSGVFIAAPAGAPVRAVAAGRVVFADEFVNLGRLVILDHGDGYLSLYGRNEQIAKQPGDEVAAGETIATAAAARGQSDSSLYFEIRHNDKPENPLLWCK